MTTPHTHVRSAIAVAVPPNRRCIRLDTTTRAAADLGFQCTLAHDACATRALSFGGATVAAADVQTAFLAALNGLFAKIQSTDEVCASL